jgi:hypothetical protein
LAGFKWFVSYLAGFWVVVDLPVGKLTGFLLTDWLLWRLIFWLIGLLITWQVGMSFA